MKKDRIVEQTKSFVKETLLDAEGGHDWFHVERVYNNAKTIAANEDVDEFVVVLAALLHDIADSKFHKGDETIGPLKAAHFLEAQDVDKVVIAHVVAIIKNISFKGGNVERSFTSTELDVVQDADRLDALGAVGIARTFNYGGYKNHQIYNPAIKPKLNQTAAEYKNSTAPTLNHFYEKLLLLKDRMNTVTGKQMAQSRHEFMELYLKQFYAEWDGRA